MTSSGGSRLWAAAAAFLGATVIAFGARARYRRYLISGSSMLPSLRDGDCVLIDARAFAHRPPNVGEVVLALVPAGIEVVKRVRHVDSAGRIWLHGDNPPESTDSRDFGPLGAADIGGLVLFRYWPLT